MRRHWYDNNVVGADLRVVLEGQDEHQDDDGGAGEDADRHPLPPV